MSRKFKAKKILSIFTVVSLLSVVTASMGINDLMFMNASSTKIKVVSTNAGNVLCDGAKFTLPACPSGTTPGSVIIRLPGTPWEPGRRHYTWCDFTLTDLHIHKSWVVQVRADGNGHHFSAPPFPLSDRYYETKCETGNCGSIDIE